MFLCAFCSGMGLGWALQGLGFRVSGSGFRVFRAWGLGLRV